MEKANHRNITIYKQLRSIVGVMAETFDFSCRLCADKVTHECLDIFGEFGINARVSEILFQHFGIEVNKSFAQQMVITK